MSSRYFLPKSAFVGIDSNGNRIKFYEWDFDVYATHELTKNIITALIISSIFSVSAPIMLILYIATLTVNILPYLSIAIASGLVLLDFHYQFICYTSSTIFFGDTGFIYLVKANIITFIISTFLSLFLPLIRWFMYRHIGDLTEEEFNSLTSKTKKDIHKKTLRNIHLVLYFMIIFSVFGYIISDNLVRSGFFPAKLKKEQRDLY